MASNAAGDGADDAVDGVVDDTSALAGVPVSGYVEAQKLEPGGPVRVARARGLPGVDFSA